MQRTAPKAITITTTTPTKVKNQKAQKRPVQFIGISFTQSCTLCLSRSHAPTSLTIYITKAASERCSNGFCQKYEMMMMKKKKMKEINIKIDNLHKHFVDVFSYKLLLFGAHLTICWIRRVIIDRLLHLFQELSKKNPKCEKHVVYTLVHTHNCTFVVIIKQLERCFRLKLHRLPPLIASLLCFHFFCFVLCVLFEFFKLFVFIFYFHLLVRLQFAAKTANCFYK